MPSAVQSISTVGLFTSGLTAGLTLAYPIIVNPLYRQSDSGLSIRDRLRLWERGYYNGLAALPLLALATAAIFVGSDLVHDAPVLGRSVGTVAGLLHVSIIPFTLIAIRPVNNVLMGMRKAADAERAYTEVDVAPLFAKWAALHNVRVALSATGFVLALLGTLGVVRL